MRHHPMIIAPVAWPGHPARAAAVLPTHEGDRSACAGDRSGRGAVIGGERGGAGGTAGGLGGGAGDGAGGGPDGGDVGGAVRLTEDVGWISEAFALPDGRFEHVSVYLIEHRRGVRSGGLGFLLPSGADSRAPRARPPEGQRNPCASPLPLGLSALRQHPGLPLRSGATSRSWRPAVILISKVFPMQLGPRSGRRCRSWVGRFRFPGPARWPIDPIRRGSTTSRLSVMFVADGFGSYHSEGQSEWTSRDYEEGISRKPTCTTFIVTRSFGSATRTRAR